MGRNTWLPKHTDACQFLLSYPPLARLHIEKLDLTQAGTLPWGRGGAVSEDSALRSSLPNVLLRPTLAHTSVGVLWRRSGAVGLGAEIPSS